MDKVLDILSSIKPGVNFDQEIDLVEKGIIDSLDIVCIVSQLNDVFDVEIGILDLVPENFASVITIYDLVQRLSE